MAKVAGSLFLVALCLCKSLAVGTKVPSFEAIPPNAWKEAFEGFAKLQKEQTTKSNRFLQETTTLFPQRAPTRSCGEIIGTATRDDVVAVASQMLQSLFPDGTQLAVFRPTALNLLTTTARFGFQAQVVCGSCSEIEQLYSGNSLLSNSNPNGWQTYCAPGRFGANETHSGLLLVPYDNLNGRTIEGTFKVCRDPCKTKRFVERERVLTNHSPQRHMLVTTEQRLTNKRFRLSSSRPIL